ncbi:molybdopterin-dependent oxidoreductase [Mesosutterella sp. AGMB02718]|uniref:Molybdopterin-dependent oxidoreductase n=1 Tax=Mesosutterella faecium TaxID=2925194 RepID=A0ABT7IPY1_9BURK|nr:molybdopterin-dependent oxidoreductase [Mesosutterella sp. AGMB02718]MDL2059941.1 molybdopterin-dependent oxidoreductase [Mesosutterella sp. AGMB02718]
MSTHEPISPGLTTASHWGVFRAWPQAGKIGAAALKCDRRGIPNLRAVTELPFLENRIRTPAARASFLEKRAGYTHLRGEDRWVALSWPEALDLAGSEINRIYDLYGPSAVFGHSYGWKSSGALHAPAALIRRMLALRGGYVRGENNYSNAAMRKILPYVVGQKHLRPQCLEVIAEHTERLVFWGADPEVTNEIDWFSTVHSSEPAWEKIEQRARSGALRTFAVNPVRPLSARRFASEWLPVRPGTDAALMLAMIHVLDEENLCDRDFLRTHVHGLEAFLDYVRGKDDGCPKSPDWAAPICGLPAETIARFARELAAHRTFLMLGWGPQRARFGEQFHWAGFALAAFLGQMGLPGGGVSGENHTGDGGAPESAGPWVENLPVPQSAAPCPVIPTARFADCLRHPGRTIDFNGRRCTYPMLRLMLWGGGNPFAHQPDSLGLYHAWRSQQLEAVIVCDTHWSATAKMADIVLPACTFFERNDISGVGEYSRDGIAAMHRIIPPMYDSRTDYWIFSELAERLGVGKAFTQGLDEEGWLHRLYGEAAGRARESGLTLPSFNAFWEKGWVPFPVPEKARGFVDFALFREDPERHPLPTPSGRIELFSEKIASFGYGDCPPHPAWLDPAPEDPRVRSRFPLRLVSPKSRFRLHSQLDPCPRKDRGPSDPEWLRIHPRDARARAIAQGDLVLARSPRGALLARASVTEDVMEGTVALAHGAWFEPEWVGDELLDLHGSSNTLTEDVPTSALACGNTASAFDVEVCRCREQDFPFRPFAHPLPGGPAH